MTNLKGGARNKHSKILKISAKYFSFPETSGVPVFGLLGQNPCKDMYKIPRDSNVYVDMH